MHAFLSAEYKVPKAQGLNAVTNNIFSTQLVYMRCDCKVTFKITQFKTKV